MFQISKATGAQNNMRLESVSRDTVFTQKSIVVYITKFYKFRGNSKSGNVIMFPWLKKKNHENGWHYSYNILPYFILI